MSIVEQGEREREPVYKKVVEAGKKLFFTDGCDNVSLDDIAEEAGVDKLTLSFYFKDAEAVFYAVVVRGARILHGLHAAGSPPDANGIEKVRSWVRVSHEFSRKYPDYFRLFSQAEAKRCDLSGNEDAVETINLVNRMLIRLIEAIKEGMGDGSIRKDLDPRETALYITLALTSVLTLEHDRESLLEDMKIGSDQFAYDFRYFVARAIASPAGEREVAEPGETAKDA